MKYILRRNPATVLLITQLLGLLVYPFMDDKVAGRAAYELFGMLVLLLTILVVRHSPAPAMINIVLAICGVGFSIASAFMHNKPWLIGASALAHALFYFAAAAGLIAYMIRDLDVTRDELIAIAATFTLLAWAFAYVFQLLQVVQPGSFAGGGVKEGTPQSWTSLLFLSSTNLSNTGLSDITPAVPLARGVVVIEQICGLAVVAVLTGYLVGLTMARVNLRTERNRPAADDAVTLSREAETQPSQGDA